jgi:hypothetical protein
VSGFLLDTNVISLVAPAKTKVAADFIGWLERADNNGQLYLSVVTVHEIEKGIRLLEHKGATAKALALRTWLSGLITSYSDRILPLDIQVTSVSGQLEAKAIASGHSPGMADALIAGTAMALELTVITRNVRHFLPFGISAYAPEDAASMPD